MGFCPTSYVRFKRLPPNFHDISASKGVTSQVCLHRVPQKLRAVGRRYAPLIQKLIDTAPKDITGFALNSNSLKNAVNILGIGFRKDKGAINVRKDIFRIDSIAFLHKLYFR